MATIEDVRRWYERDLGRYANWDDCVMIVPPADNMASDGEYLRIRIFTDNNWYSITARNPKPQYRETEPPEMPDDRGSVEPRSAEPRPAIMDAGYLGCGSSSRKPRAGEDWHRGSDLADGPLTEETWHKIIGDIVSYELVRVHHAPHLVRSRSGILVPVDDKSGAAVVARP